MDRALGLTDEQYERLTWFVDGKLHFFPYGAREIHPLVRRGFVTQIGRDCQIITSTGRLALAAYRQRHGIEAQ